MFDGIPDRSTDVDGSDLQSLLDAYVDACRRVDLPAAAAAANQLYERAGAHRVVRQCEADDLGLTWEDLAPAFGLDAVDAWTSFGPDGPPPPDEVRRSLGELDA